MEIVWFWQRKGHQTYEKFARREGIAVWSENHISFLGFQKEQTRWFSNTMGTIVDLPWWQHYKLFCIILKNKKIRTECQQIIITRVSLIPSCEMSCFGPDLSFEGFSSSSSQAALACASHGMQRASFAWPLNTPKARHWNRYFRNCKFK